MDTSSLSSPATEEEEEVLFEREEEGISSRGQLRCLCVETANKRTALSGVETRVVLGLLFTVFAQH